MSHRKSYEPPEELRASIKIMNQTQKFRHDEIIKQLQSYEQSQKVGK